MNIRRCLLQSGLLHLRMVYCGSLGSWAGKDPPLSLVTGDTEDLEPFWRLHMLLYRCIIAPSSSPRPRNVQSWPCIESQPLPERRAMCLLETGMAKRDPVFHELNSQAQSTPASLASWRASREMPLQSGKCLHFQGIRAADKKQNKQAIRQASNLVRFRHSLFLTQQKAPEHGSPVVPRLRVKIVLR